jgi:hypothetical protein
MVNPRRHLHGRHRATVRLSSKLTSSECGSGLGRAILSLFGCRNLRNRFDALRSGLACARPTAGFLVRRASTRTLIEPPTTIMGSAIECQISQSKIVQKSGNLPPLIKLSDKTIGRTGGMRGHLVGQMVHRTAGPPSNFSVAEKSV